MKKIVYAISFILPIFTMDNNKTRNDKTAKKPQLNKDVPDRDRSRTPKKDLPSRINRPSNSDSNSDSDSDKTPKKSFRKNALIDDGRSSSSDSNKSKNHSPNNHDNDPNRTPKKSNSSLFINLTTKKEYFFQRQTGPNNETPKKDNDITFSPLKYTPNKYKGLGYTK